MSRKSSIQELHHLEQVAQDQGWTVNHTRNGKVQFIPPGPRHRISVVTSSVRGSTDWRGMRNLRSYLRHRGLPV